MSVVETPVLPETIEDLKKYAILQHNELSRKKEQINTLIEKYENLNIKHNDLNIKYDEKNQAYNEKVQAYEEKAQAYLEVCEKFKILQSAFFGRSSEKWNVDDKLQASLFNEAEIAIDEEGIRQAADSDIITYTVIKNIRGKRLSIPENIPREEIILDIPDEEKICECGYSLVKIGEETSEKLDIIPAQIKVIRYIRPKWACSHCEGSGDESRPAVRIAPPAKELLSKSIATAGLVSHIITSKYCDALPLYRQEKLFKRIGVEIKRASMARWIITLAGRLSPLLELMDEAIRGGPLIQMDETSLQVHKEHGKADHTKSYMWVALGGSGKKQIIRYLYHPARRREVPAAYLKGYSGYLQTDAYAGYNKAVEDEDITHVLCLAHARRKFDEAARVNGGSPAAREFISIIQRIYRIEKELRRKELSDGNFILQRKEQTAPFFEKLDKQLEKKAAQVVPSSALGRAITYTIEVLPKVKKYQDLACLTPDNNAAERAIRPFVVGRKNWMHADTPSGAHASACFYSLLESAKSFGLEPYWYIRHVLKKLPELETHGNWQSLMPEVITPEILVGSS